MFSSRFHWDLKPNRLTSLRNEKRAAGDELLDLTESNPTRAGLDYPADEIVSALANPGILTYEPAPAGLTSSREAVAGYYAARGHSIGTGQVLLTASTSEAYAYIFKLLTNPGDEVLVPRPSYPLFEFLASMESVSVRQYPLVYHGGWSIDLAALRERVTPRTRAILLVNPNNPTGSYLKRDELDDLALLARRHELVIVSDEVFADYPFGPDARRVGSLASFAEAPAFVLSGLSKVAALPQLKLGWIVAAGPAAYRKEALAKLEWIADTYLSVGTPVQLAAPGLLALSTAIQEQITRRVRGNLAFVAAALNSNSPCRVLAVEGGWYATLQVPRIRSEEEWCLQLLAEDGVLVQPGFFFDFESE